MLAGKQPFRVENTASQLEQSQLVIRIITEPISDPRDHYPAIPQRFVDVIKRATEKKKVDRIQSVEEFKHFMNAKNIEQPFTFQPNTAKNSNSILSELSFQSNDVSESQTKMNSNQENIDIRHQQLAMILQKRKKKKKIVFGVLGVIALFYLFVILQSNKSRTSNPWEMVFVKG